jgi:mono/diheme cytochrome c family protein
VKALWLIVASLATLPAGACDSGASSTDGAQVFASVCVTCHGPTGKPNEMMVAKLGVKDLTSEDVRKTLTAAKVEDQVRNGSKNKLMPGFAGALGDAQIKAVAAYVMSRQFLAH